MSTMEHSCFPPDRDVLHDLFVPPPYDPMRVAALELAVKAFHGQPSAFITEAAGVFYEFLKGNNAKAG